MLNKGCGLDFSISSTIKDIPEDDWNRLFAKDIVEGWGYHKTMEESNLSGFSFYYLIARENNAITAIIPFFITDFSFTTIIQGRLQKFILKAQKIFPRSFRIKLLFVGLPTAENLYLGIAQDKLSDIMDAALPQLYRFAKTQKISTILFYNLTQEQKGLAEYLTKQGFGRMENFPNTQIKINANSLEEYIGHLRKNARKDLRRKLRNSPLAELTTELVEDVDGIGDELYELYLDSFTDSDVQFEVLTPEFFRNICRNMKGVAKFFITRNKEQILAFNLCLVKDNICIDKSVGFADGIARKYHLYHTTFCHNIDWCIKNGVRLYQPGITDYHQKLRLGAKLIPLYVYIKSLNPALNPLVKFIARLTEPKRFDPVLKNLKY